MLKLLLSAYFIIVGSFFAMTYTLEFVINNGFIAGNNGMTDAVTASYSVIVIFFIYQLATTAIVKNLFFKELK